MYILLVLRERTSSVRFFCFCFTIEFILCLAFSLFVYHRCHIAFLGLDVISLLRLGAVCFVSFLPLPFCSVQRANVYILDVFFIWVWHRSHIAFLGRDIISLGGRVAEINQSTNQPYMFCLVSKSCSSPRGRATGVKNKRRAKQYQYEIGESGGEREVVAKGRNADPGKGNYSEMTYECIVWRVVQRMRRRIRRSRHLGGIW